ncbi:hypothetical protein BAY60_18705 [Prauserella muralis]|uniref:Uncharacterized protein n=1 Tax=Prauserella muralis TaxID=588067 RepID=A0A2V4AVS6_9PSEU|nr:hypothetical protein BAY60_18705 [Prauserella muralis]
MAAAEMGDVPGHVTDAVGLGGTSFPAHEDVAVGAVGHDLRYASENGEAEHDDVRAQILVEVVGEHDYLAAFEVFLDGQHGRAAAVLHRRMLDDGDADFGGHPVETARDYRCGDGRVGVTARGPT